MSFSSDSETDRSSAVLGADLVSETDRKISKKAIKEAVKTKGPLHKPVAPED